MSEDGGDTWRRIQTNAGDISKIYQILVNPDDGTLYSLIEVRRSVRWGIERYSGGQVTRILGYVRPQDRDTFENTGGVLCVRSSLLPDQFYLYHPQKLASDFNATRFVLGGRSANPGVTMDASIGSGQGYRDFYLQIKPGNPDMLYAFYEPFDDQANWWSHPSYVSADGGASWNQLQALWYIKSNLAFRPGEDVAYIWSSPTSSATGSLLAELRDTGDISRFGNPIPEKADAGNLWAHPMEPGIFLLAGIWRLGAPFNDAIYRTTDNGLTWTKAAAGLADYGDVGIISDAHGEHIYIFQHNNSNFLRSDDGGASWQRQVNPIGKVSLPMVVNPANGLELLVAAGAGIYHSTDGGNTWKPVSPLQATELAIGATTPRTLYAATNDGLWVSLDGGVSWGVIRQGLSASQIIYSVAVDPVDPSRVYIATPDGVFRLVAQGQ